MLATEVRSGDAPKPPFPMKTYEQFEKTGSQPQIIHRIFSLFLSLHNVSDTCHHHCVRWIEAMNEQATQKRTEEVVGRLGNRAGC